MASNHVAFVTAGGLTDATVAHSLYGYCTTAAATVAKVVTMYKTGSTAGAAWAAADLVHGLTITVRFQYSNTAASPTLNVNSTGAKPIYKYGTTAPGTTAATSWPAQGVVQLTYDTLLNTSGCWVMNDHIDDTNTTYTAATAAPGNVASASAQGTSTNYARQDHTHGIALATGDANGQVKIAGTNVSVKGLGTAAYTASTAYATSSHTHSYLPLTGGTLTGALSGTTTSMSGNITSGGNLTFGNGTSGTINASTPSRNAGIIWVGGGKKAAGDGNGTVVRIQSGGLMIVGGGEYPNNRYNVADLDDGSEQLYLGADGNVYIESNGNTIADRKTWTFGTNGVLTTPADVVATSTFRATTSADATLANNGVSSTLYPAWYASDKNNKILARMESVIAADGNIGAFWYVRNYKADGTQAGQKGIRMTMAKDGALTYSVSDPAKFRDAIDVPAAKQIGNYWGICPPSGVDTGWIRTPQDGLIPYENGGGNSTIGTASWPFKAVYAKTIWLEDNINIQYEGLDSSLTNNGLSANVSHAYGLIDKNSKYIGFVEGWAGTNGDIYAGLQSRKIVNGANVNNTLRLRIKNDGTKTVEVSDPAAWRTAIGIPYGTCGTAAATVAKVVSATGFTLTTGALVLVKFTVTNTGAVASLTLNVNSTGAKNIKYRNGNLPAVGTLAANRVYAFVYDGTYYQLLGDLDTNTGTTDSAITSETIDSICV